MSSVKLFVKSLSWNTTTDALKNYFSKFGEIAQANVVVDRMTGRSRGFGFVTFSDPESLSRTLAEENHEIDGRLVFVNQAEERSTNFNFTNNGGFTRSGFRSYNNNNNNQGNGFNSNRPFGIGSSFSSNNDNIPSNPFNSPSNLNSNSSGQSSQPSGSLNRNEGNEF